MKLRVLCHKLIDIPARYDVEINGLNVDSRLIQPGDLFLACPGIAADGHDFIHAAIEKGAVAVLCEASRHIFNEVVITTEDGRVIPVFAVPHLLQSIGALASYFYGEPSEHLTVYGVTGTNGKTSVTHYLAACLNALQQTCAVLGTVGNGFLNHLTSSNYTTADAIQLHKMLQDYRSQGAKAIAMEVSSHGLQQGRVNGVHFHTAVFTNLTRDHLDYHGTMENYAAAKRKLFEFPDLQYAVINLDDHYGQQLMQSLTASLLCYGYLISDAPYETNELALVQASQVQYDPQGFSAKVYTPWGQGKITCRLYGHFNLSNVLAVITVLGIQQVDFNRIIELVSNLRGVKGRMELIKTPDQPAVIIDYAHTPDALEKALQAIKLHAHSKIWCVFGCGGDRDPGKRPLMGNIAELYADYVIITTDNPRHEEPAIIAEQIVGGLKNKAHANIILDRTAAIDYAITQAHPNDIILIAGKGHEEYQQIGDTKHPYSDQQIVEKLISKSRIKHE